MGTFLSGGVESRVGEDSSGSGDRRLAASGIGGSAWTRGGSVCLSGGMPDLWREWPRGVQLTEGLKPVEQGGRGARHTP